VFLVVGCFLDAIPAIIVDRERQVVTFLGLRLDEDLALARGVGGGGARDAGEEHGQEHVDFRERSRSVADHRTREMYETSGASSVIFLGEIFLDNVRIVAGKAAP
jgi:hypothetical protein